MKSNRRVLSVFLAISLVVTAFLYASNIYAVQSNGRRHIFIDNDVIDCGRPGDGVGKQQWIARNAVPCEL